MMFLLDSDHLIIVQRNQLPEADRLRRRFAQHAEENLYLSIVSVHEQLLGAHSFISRAKKPEDIVRGYAMLETAMSDYAQYKILPFDEPAANLFQSLRAQGVRVGTMDLRIAAIAISHGLTVLTRNLVDFGKVPQLLVEDWTTPE